LPLIATHTASKYCGTRVLEASNVESQKPAA
jgi:hypothetical protein